MGQRLTLAVVAQQPGDVDDAVVHRAALRPPGHVLEQPLQQALTAHPAGEQVDPRTPCELVADGAGQGAERWAIG